MIVIFCQPFTARIYLVCTEQRFCIYIHKYINVVTLSQEY